MRRFFIAAFLSLGLLGSGLFPLSAMALSGSDFQAGRIMDDGVFFNANTFDITSIQNFLNSKVPICDTWGSQPYAGTTRAAYGASKGHPTPYTCLKDYRQDTPAKGAETGLCGNLSGGNKSSAQIIYDVAQSCGINPKVLIVLLEKEQSLVTDDWPWDTQYRSATGYGCPDTAPCDAEYYGFFNQVYNAARQFKRYSRDSTLFSYRAFRDNYIQYNPVASCGGTNVYIQNQATAGLYNYTPYQPNAGALSTVSDNSAGGTANCGAYGNRNFWWLFSKWFGSPITPPFAWSYVSQSAYTGLDMTTQVDANHLKAGQRVVLQLKAKNIGTETWHQSGTNAVHLGTDQPKDRTSQFCDGTWLSCSRPAGLVENSVVPGQVGTLNFWVTAPGGIGSYQEHFNLVSEGLSWFNDLGLYYTLGVDPTYSWAYMNHAAYTDSSRTQPTNSNNQGPGQRIYMTLTAINTGNTTWSNGGSNPIRLGTSNPYGRNSSLCDVTWISCSRVAALNETSVSPGQVGTFGFWVTTPSNLGTYNEHFNLLSEGYMWMNENNGLYYTIKVNPATYTWSYGGQAAYTDASKTTPVNTGALTPSQRVFLTLQAKNTGNVTWYKYGTAPIRLGTGNPYDRNSSICDATWISCSRVAALSETSVAPGQTGNFGFWANAPSQTGTYNEYFNPLAENLIWLNNLGQHYTLKAN